MANIVAGAGIWGCTIARRLAEAGRKVLVLEKRAAVGGNCRCEIDPETGIEVHTYGSHIFHTRNKEVWGFVNRFAKFNDYRHCVLANHAGRIYHLPFGRTLYDEFFGKGNYELPLNDSQNAAIFEAFIKHYTSKQWGVPPEKVDPSVIARLKVRDSYSTDYFDDPHQGIPIDGYNALFERMLDHPNIEVKCDTSFNLSTFQPFNFSTVYYSGPVDALFGYKYGPLPWRTLNFELETLNCSDFQHNSVVNYPDIDVPYTRIHEFRHYHPEWERKVEKRGGGGQRTIIMKEFSSAWRPGDEPYYPIATPESAALLKKYQDEVELFNSSTVQPFNLVVGGRLGGYRYYDMDQALAAALEVEV